jgi:predicted nucleotidyltransferase
VKEQTQSAIRLLEALTERAKELTCLYEIEGSLREPDADIAQVCDRITQAIPPGWQFPDICAARITLEGKEYCSPGFEETPWKLMADLVQQDLIVGTIGVYYVEEMPEADIGPFLKEEKKLIETIADRINHFLTYKKMNHVIREWQDGDRDLSESPRGDWEAVLDLVRQTDNALFLRLSNKMLNHLCWSGIEEAETLRRTEERQESAAGNHFGDEAKGHRPSRVLGFSTEFTEKIFQIAAGHLSDEEILSRVHMWIEEDKLGALLRTVRRRLPLSEVSSRLRRYFFTTREETDSKYPLARGLKVLLIECILSNRLDYINVAKNEVDIEDLYHLLQKVIFSPESHGKLGGKSAGLFLASRVLINSGRGASDPSIGIPRTWYVSSDMMLEFIHYNNMDEIVEQKYKDLERVRLEYPQVTKMFRHAAFPPEIANSLSMALDDLGDGPLVVRSSSLLEDRTGTTFAGKYKSVFLGNQGTREERLRDLMRAVAEVYASNFGPDPIECRADRGLLEYSEQMGIMIQEAVGTRVGPYFLPAYSGVARGRNDLQWLPGISGEDGMIRIIPGLGTHASDRTGDEYPVLAFPGRPSIRVNGATEESFRHSPRRVDVINLEINRVETVELKELMKNFGEAYPGAELVVSRLENGRIQPVDMDKSKLEKQNLVVTFDGLITRSPFVMQIRNLLRTLEEKLGVPVEIEFASDGERIYVLQCCPLARARVPRPAPIPKDIAKEQLVLSANRHISNGCVSNITHVVYLRPAAYEALEEPAHRRAVGQAVAKLNELLPKQQFILIRPGSWTSGGDPRPGVELTFKDFKNAAVLVDLLQSGSAGDTPLSVSVHFLQDLVESGISFLPIFLDDEESFVNERVLLRPQNIFPELLPEYAFLADVIRVIDVPNATDGKVVQVLMNAELGEAVGVLADPEQDIGSPEEGETFEDENSENYWRWRHRIAEQIASRLEPVEFGVEGVYLFGSTKNGTAGPASDIDMLIHFTGTPTQREDLVHWLEGWSLCLDEINYLRTGYRSGGLLDVHIVTDEDIAKKTSYAVKINAITDAARPLKTKRTENRTHMVPGEPMRESGKGIDQ